MGNDKDLKLIKTPKPLDGASNFWKVCPRVLDFVPNSPCHMGKPTIAGKSKRVQDEPQCPWWINSEEHHYCFWRYVQDKSSPEGAMPELVQSELASLFGWSNTKTHFVLKEAIEELTNALKTYGAVQLLSEMDNSQYVEMFSESSYQSDDSDDSY